MNAEPHADCVSLFSVFALLSLSLGMRQCAASSQAPPPPLTSSRKQVLGPSLMPESHSQALAGDISPPSTSTHTKRQRQKERNCVCVLVIFGLLFYSSHQHQHRRRQLGRCPCYFAT